MALLAGHPLLALGHNPLVVLAGAVGIGLLLFQMVAGRRIRLVLTRKQSRAILFAGVLLVLMNWAFVILYVG